MGIKLSELLIKINNDIKNLDEVYDSEIYGSDSLTEETFKKISVKVKNDKVQCFLMYNVVNFDTSMQRKCISSDEILAQCNFAVVVFANINKQNDFLKFSTVGCDASQKIIGILENTNFGFDDAVKDYSKIYSFSQIGDANLSNNFYQIFLIDFGLEVALSKV